MMRFIDLAAHDHEGSALVPFERSATMKRHIWEHWMVPNCRPRTDEGLERLEPRVGNQGFAANVGVHARLPRVSVSLEHGASLEPGL